MDNLKQKTLALFLTRGMSLEKWDKLGQISREVKLYSTLALHFKKIFIITYGRHDAKYRSLFPNNIEIVHWTKCFSRKFDLIKTNQMDGSVLAVIVKKVSGAKLVVRCGYEWLKTIELAKKSFLKRHIAKMVEHIAYKNADAIILTSAADKKFVSERFGKVSEKITILPNFVDTSLFYPAPEQKEKNRMMFVGRFEKEKNLEHLFEALIGLPVKLVLAGKGILEGKLRNYAQTHRLDVVFLGPLPQKRIAEELQKSELFALPSLYEGSPKALLEAMATGLVCIGGDNEGTREVIQDGVNGLVASAESESIHDCLARLAADDILKKQLGNQARETILQKFSFEKHVEKELALYRTLL